FLLNPYLLSTLGANILIIRATDTLGNITTNNVTVTLDTQSPVFGAITPANNSTLNSLNATISGSVSDNLSIASVSVNGTVATVNAGNFTAPITFAAGGDNSVVVIATDAAGNTASQTLSYRVLTGNVLPPTIMPALPAATNQNPLTISGTAAAGTGIRITG